MIAHSNLTLTCPACGSNNSLEACLAHGDAARAIIAALNLSGHTGRLVMGYLGLFKPRKSALSAAKRASTLESIVEMINAGEFERRSNVHTAPRELWDAGLTSVLEQANKGTVATPLNGHAYLLEVMHRMIEQGQAKAETRSEHKRQVAGGAARFDAQHTYQVEQEAIASKTAADEAPPPTAEQIAAIRKSIANIGKNMTMKGTPNGR